MPGGAGSRPEERRKEATVYRDGWNYFRRGSPLDNGFTALF